MAGNSGIFFLVIAFTLFAAQQDFQELKFTEPTAKICLSGALTEPCSVRFPNYKEAGDKFYEAFNELVETKLTNPNSENKTTNTDELRESLLKFLDVGNKTCRKGQQPNTYNFDLFLEIVNVSLRNVTALKELHNDGGFTCIDEHKTDINQCVNNSLTSETRFTNHTQNGRLMGKAHLKFDSLTCDITNSIRNCTLDILKTNCKTNAVNFVKRLFAITDERCKEVWDKIIKTSGSHKITAYWSTFAMIALWNGLVVFNF